MKSGSDAMVTGCQASHRRRCTTAAAAAIIIMISLENAGGIVPCPERMVEKKESGHKRR